MNDSIFRKLFSCVSDILKDFELHQFRRGIEFCTSYPQIRSDMFIKLILYCSKEMSNILFTIY